MSQFDESVPQRNQRGEARREVNFIAWADLGEALPIVRCQILNMSASGAHVAPLDSNVVLPDEFRMTLDETGELWDARVVWRCGHTAGVKIARAAGASLVTPTGVTM